MTWWNENWGWLAAGVLGVTLVYAFSKLAEKRKQRAEAKKVLEFIVGLMQAFAEIIAEGIGKMYSTENRQKIAAGMVVVVMRDRIPLERLTERTTFEAVLVKSIKMLTDSHQISQIR
ncbi:MAG TPA: hypothetical protein VG488_04840 [Candidatus Angelobacter sp.]|jgi:hypothetical protein|nr:hypothetical protein [Candidatus Angelobacter sp.]